MTRLLLDANILLWGGLLRTKGTPKGRLMPSPKDQKPGFCLYGQHLANLDQAVAEQVKGPKKWEPILQEKGLCPLPIQVCHAELAGCLQVFHRQWHPFCELDHIDKRTAD
jgi:hypothetical protein